MPFRRSQPKEPPKLPPLPPPKKGQGPLSLVRGMKDILPASILARGKMGFGAPLGVWFRGDLQPLVRERLLPLIEAMQQRHAVADIVPLSAQDGDNLPALEKILLGLLPEHPAYFGADQITDRNDRFQASEFVREQVFRRFGEEVPYAVAVEITEFREEPKHQHIEAVIWVEKEGQKAILIGKGGASLKEIGRSARLELQKAFGRKVYLGLWVKVREGWSNDARAMKSLGYNEEG